MPIVRVLLVSTYDLGRQPFGLASPAAWLRQAGFAVDCLDASRDAFDDERHGAASIVAFYLPMHTATRLAGPLIDRVRTTNPTAVLAAYGLYAPLNASWLRDRGVTHVFGPEAEAELVAIARSQVPNPNAQRPTSETRVSSPESRAPSPESRAPSPQSPIPKLHFIQPDRSTLPPLQRYAALQMPDGTRRTVGSTDATRGCKHLCRHCPIVPVYRGVFRVIPIDVVMADVHAQVGAGAQHISFGDADFFNGPGHARRLVERLAAECPGITYDATIKIEHLLKHADLLPLLRDTGCLFVTSAVESVDDDVLAKLRKGHTRADFVRAVELCRATGVALSPTFVPFTPWTTLGGYVELLEQIEALALAAAVAPIQLGIRLLVTAESALLELPDLRAGLEPFDAASLLWPWRHRDPQVDALQRDVMALVASSAQSPRSSVFAAIAGLAWDRAGAPRRGQSRPASAACSTCCSPQDGIPHLTEAWYCCAEPTSDEASAVAPALAEPHEYL